MAYYVKTGRSQPPDCTGSFSVSFSGEKAMMLPAFKFMEIACVWHGPSLE